MFTINKIELIQLLKAEVFINSKNLEFIYQVSTDNRKMIEKHIFYCFRGKNYDAHDFLENIISQHPSCIIIEKNISQSLLNLAKNLDIEVLKVEDTRLAYFQTACEYLKKFPEVKKIGITGSVGKTTLCQTLSQILEQYFPKKICYTKNNNNNIIGVSHTIYQLKKQDQYLILELGTNSFGEIPLYAKNINFDYAFLTNISSSHIGNFHSIDNIAREKLSLIKHSRFSFIHSSCLNWLKEYSLLNIPHLLIELDIFFIHQVKSLKQVETIISWKEKSHKFEHEFPQKSFSITLSFIFSLIQKESLDLNILSHYIKNLRHLNNRMQIIEKSSTVHILDSYNASYLSFYQGFEILSQIQSNELIFIIADVLELGDYSFEIHWDIKKSFEKLIGHNYKKIFVLGKEMQKVFKQDKKCIHLSSINDFNKRFIKDFSNCIIYYKGSRKFKLEKIYSLLSN